MLKKYSRITPFKAWLLLLTLVVGIYWGVWNGYFQQDEWLGLGNYYSLGQESVLIDLKRLYWKALASQNIRFLYLAPFANYFRYTLFKTNFEYYSIFALSLHTINGLAVFLLLNKCGIQRRTAFVSAAIFSLISVHMQAVSWVSTSTTTQLALFFSLISITMFLEWLNNAGKKNLVLSVIFALLAAGSKETSYFLVFFLPYILITKKKDKHSNNMLYIVAIYFVSTVVSSFASKRVGILDKVKLLFKNTAQILFPNEVLVGLWTKVLNNLAVGPDFGTTQFDVFLQESIIRPFMILFGILFWLLSWRLLSKDKNTNKLFNLFFTMFILSTIPLLFIPTRELSDVFFSPRNLYLSSIGVVGVLGLTFQKYIKNKAMLAAFLLLVLVNLYGLRKQVNMFVRQSQTRRNIINAIFEQNQDLPDRVVFYIKSDASYYGMPEEIKFVPFQSGFGRSLLVLYQDVEKYPPEMFLDSYLYPIKSQGYKEVRGQGFGYFRDIDLLKETVVQYNIPKENVIAFSWNSELESLKDISVDIRNKL